MRASGRRDRLLVSVVVVVVVAIGVIVGYAVSPSRTRLAGDTHPATGTLPVAASQGALPVGSPLPTASVAAMQMLTPSRGVAVAQLPAAEETGVSYLAATVDGGVHWHVTGQLPTGMAPSQTYEVALGFSTPSDGYVTLLDSPRTISTSNAGRTWSAVQIPGQPTALSMVDGSAWVLTNRCPTPSTVTPFCPTDLAVLPVGDLASGSLHAIPAMGPVRASFRSTTFEANLLSRTTNLSGLVYEGEEGARTSILATTKAGQSWDAIPVPCEGLDIGGLVQLTTKRWVLYCDVDGGMYHGPSGIWTTSNAARTWHAASGTVQPAVTVTHPGPGIDFDLAASGNGKTLWLLGGVFEILHSTDNGASWSNDPGVRGTASTPATRELVASDGYIQTGGYDGQIVTAGPTDGWLALPGEGIFRTEIGRALGPAAVSGLTAS